MASSDAKPVPIKGQAYRVTFPMFKNDGTVITGWTSPSCLISKDGGTAVSTTNTPAEIATSFGIGYLDLTSTEMDADTVAIKPSVTNAGALTQPIILYPQEAGDLQANVTYWNGSAVAAPDTAGCPKVTIKAGTGAGEISLSSGIADAQVRGIDADAITAVVAAIDAGSDQLARIAAKTDLISANNVTYTTPVTPQTGDLTLVRGDDYTVTSGRALPQWSNDDWAIFDLPTAAITFRARARYSEAPFERAAAAISGTSVQVELTAAQTASLAVGHEAYQYDLEAALASGDVITLAQGRITVIEDVR